MSYPLDQHDSASVLRDDDEVCAHELTATELERALTFYALQGGIERMDGSIRHALHYVDIALPSVAVVDRLVSLTSEGVIESVAKCGALSASGASRRQPGGLKNAKSFYRRRSTEIAEGSSATNRIEQQLLDTLSEQQSMFSTSSLLGGVQTSEDDDEQQLQSMPVVSRFVTQQEWVALLTVLKQCFLFAVEHAGVLTEERDCFAAIATYVEQPKVDDDGEPCHTTSSDTNASADASSSEMVIASEKLQQVFSSFGLSFDICAFMAALDENGDGSVDFNEFLALVASSDDSLESYLPAFVACGGREVCVSDRGHIKPPSESTHADDTALILSVKDLCRSLPYLPSHIIAQIPPNRQQAAEAGGSGTWRGAGSHSVSDAQRRRKTATTLQRTLMREFRNGGVVIEDPVTPPHRRVAPTTNSVSPSRPAAASTSTPFAGRGGTSSAEVTDAPSAVPFDCDPRYVTLQRFAKMMHRWGKRPPELNIKLQQRLKMLKQHEDDMIGSKRRQGSNEAALMGDGAMSLLIRACCDIEDMSDDVFGAEVQNNKIDSSTRDHSATQERMGNSSLWSSSAIVASSNIPQLEGGVGSSSIHATRAALRSDVFTSVRENQRRSAAAFESSATDVRLDSSLAIGSRAIAGAAESALLKHYQRIGQHRSEANEAQFNNIDPPMRMPRFSPKRDDHGRAPLHAPKRSVPKHGDAQHDHYHHHHSLTPSTPPKRSHEALFSPDAAQPPAESNFSGVVNTSPRIFYSSKTNPHRTLPADTPRSRAASSETFTGAATALFSESSPRSPAAAARFHRTLGQSRSSAKRGAVSPCQPDDPTSRAEHCEWWNSMRAVLMDKKQLREDTKCHLALMQQWARPCSSVAGLTQGDALSPSTTHSSLGVSRPDSVQVVPTATSHSMASHRRSPPQSSCSQGPHPSAPSLHVPTRPNTAGRGRPGTAAVQQVSKNPSQMAQKSPSPVLLASRVSPPLVPIPMPRVRGGCVAKPKPPTQPAVGIKRRARKHPPHLSPAVRQQTTALPPSVSDKKATRGRRPHSSGLSCSVVPSLTSEPVTHPSLLRNNVCSSELDDDDGDVEFLCASATDNASERHPIRAPNNDDAPHDGFLVMRDRRRLLAIGTQCVARRIQRWWRCVTAKLHTTGDGTVRATFAAIRLQAIGRGFHARQNISNILLARAKAAAVAAAAAGALQRTRVLAASAMLLRVTLGYTARRLVYLMRLEAERLEEQDLFAGNYLGDEPFPRGELYPRHHTASANCSNFESAAAPGAIPECGDEREEHNSTAFISILPLDLLRSAGFPATGPQPPEELSATLGPQIHATKLGSDETIAFLRSSEEERCMGLASIESPRGSSSRSQASSSTHSPSSPSAHRGSFRVRTLSRSDDASGASPTTWASENSTADVVKGATAVVAGTTGRRHSRQRSMDFSDCDHPLMANRTPPFLTCGDRLDSTTHMGGGSSDNAETIESNGSYGDFCHPSGPTTVLGVPLVENPFLGTDETYHKPQPRLSMTSGVDVFMATAGVGAPFGRSVDAIFASVNNNAHTDASRDNTSSSSSQGGGGATAQMPHNNRTENCSTLHGLLVMSPPTANSSLRAMESIEFEALGGSTPVLSDADGTTPTRATKKFDGFAAPMMIYRVMRGYHVRKRLFQRLMRVIYEQPLLSLQRLGRGLRARRRLGDQKWAAEDAKSALSNWKVRDAAATTIQCCFRRARAIEISRAVKRRVQARLHMRTSAEGAVALLQL